MIAGALFYYQAHSLGNRLWQRVRRLRQPKYLVGAVVGAGYFYWYIFRTLGRGALPGRSTWLLAPEHRFFAESIGALVLLVLMLMAWIMPHSRAALTFTEAEIAFLFPAPISRQTLLHFKLLKSQTAILFSAVFMTLLGRGFGSGNFLMRILDWWALLSIFNLHLLGSSFALTRLMDRGVSNWKRRLAVLLPAAAVAVGVALWVRRSLPPPPPLESLSFDSIERYARGVFEARPVAILLTPFRMVVAPFLASTGREFLGAFAATLAIVALHYLWVVRSDVAFEEASIEASRKMAERVAAARTGQWGVPSKAAKAARAPFTLRPAGNPLVAIFWKNLISAGRFVTVRMFLLALWIIFVVGFAMHSSHGGRGMTGVLAFAALGFTAMSLFSGPQMLRNDLRQDLPVSDVLKMFPMPGWQMVLGEVLAPAAMLAAAQWLFLTVAVIFWPEDFHRSAPLLLRAEIGLAAALVLPCVDVIAILIPNAAALFFPAWFQLGKDGPRGFEMTGQQLILMFGQLLVLACCLLPAAGVAAAILVAGSYMHFAGLAALAAGLAAALILAAEAALGIRLLGTVFEDFDLSAELVSS